MSRKKVLFLGLALLFGMSACNNSSSPSDPDSDEPTPTPSLSPVPTATATRTATRTPTIGITFNVQMLANLYSGAVTYGGSVTYIDPTLPVTCTIVACNYDLPINAPISVFSLFTGSAYQLEAWGWNGIMPYTNSSRVAAADPYIMSYGTGGIATFQEGLDGCVTISSVYRNMDIPNSACQTFISRNGAYLPVGQPTTAPITVIVPCVSPVPTFTATLTPVESSTFTPTASPIETSTPTDSPTPTLSSTSTPEETLTTTPTETSTVTPDP
jgi:hypothetical protein